jgi:methionyl-tRNA formyltransferase
MQFTFDKISRILLLGGSSIMADLIDQVKEFEVAVVTSERFLKEVLEQRSQTFENFLLERNIPFISSVDVNSDPAVHRMITTDCLGISVSAPWIIKAGFIERFHNRQLVNIHTSILPQFRGGGGISWKMLNGIDYGAYSIHFITPRIDDGDVLLSERFEYPAEMNTLGERNNYDSSECTNGLYRFLQRIRESESFLLTRQDESESTYFPRLDSRIHGFINWNWDAADIVKFIRAFSHPYHGAKTQVNEKIVRINTADLRIGFTYHPFTTGLIIRKTPGSFFVACRDAEIELSAIEDEKGMDILHLLKLGDRLYTSYELLETSLKHRAFYNYQGLIKK